MILKSRTHDLLVITEVMIYGSLGFNCLITLLTFRVAQVINNFFSPKIFFFDRFLT